MPKISKIRHAKVREQSGLCFYCQQPMWEDGPELFARNHGLKGRRVYWLRATAEHLVARQDGGLDVADNIVAACSFCNSRRHYSAAPLPPAEYAQEVRRRLASGRWHGLLLGSKLPNSKPFISVGCRSSVQETCQFPSSGKHKDERT